jgi:hypothetical protein
MTLKSGNNNKGNNAVTEIETVSVIHQQTIHRAVAITLSALLEIISNGKNCTMENKTGPKKRPIFFE